MTDLEQTVLSHLVDAWNAFLRLPIEHSDDIDEFRHGIHALQKQIMARPARRDINRPLSIQERTDAAVKAERERSERLNPNQESPRKAAEAVPERAAQSDAVTPAPESAKSAGGASGYASGLPVNHVDVSQQARARYSEVVDTAQHATDREIDMAVASLVNERCVNPSACKFSHHPHKITCPSCGSAWAARRKREVAA
jgi:hypothetical protein